MSDLPTRIRTVLAGLSVISDGLGPAPRPSGRRAPRAPGSFAPAGARESLRDRYERRIRRAIANGDRAALHAAVVAAERALDGARRPPAPRVTPENWREWLIDTYEGVHYAEVAEREGVSRSWVRKLRASAGREPLYGRAPVPSGG